MKILNDLTGLFDFRISIQYIKNMIKKVLNFIKENNMLQNGDSVVLGVSGGADSICMLYVLKEISKFINLKKSVDIRAKIRYNTTCKVKTLYRWCFLWIRY